MAEQNLLIIDDEYYMIKGLQRVLSYELEDVEVDICSRSDLALRMLLEKHYDLVLLDIRMPEVDGLELLPKIKKIHPDIQVIMMTAFGNIDLAVQSIKQGAFDFISKPFEMPDLIELLHSGLKRSRLRNRKSLSPRHSGLADLIGKTRPMQELFALISSIAPTDYSVLIRGESGTGKELVARSIHNLSPRKDREFITVNCPALPEHLLESELFGYKKGAFTGALQDKKGLFQEAHGSSILLDEIADIPIPVQTKLLRVLQEQEIRPLGSNKNTPVDVRILSTTNQDLEQKLQDKTFREDLFFRLNVVTIKTPALEEIKDDIPLMVDFFIQQTCAEMDIPPKPFSPGAIERLKHRAWPGNVRELQNVVRRALIFSTENEVTPGDITQVETNEQKRENSVENPRGEGLEPYNQAKERVLQKFSAEYVEHLMQETGGNISQAAKLGGLSRVALQKILRRTGVDPQRFRDG
jgi:DNA-binding NtrC family response regulator